MNGRTARFVSRGRRQLNKAFASRDLKAVKRHTKRELEALAKLYGRKP